MISKEMLVEGVEVVCFFGNPVVESKIMQSSEALKDETLSGWLPVPVVKDEFAEYNNFGALYDNNEKTRVSQPDYIGVTTVGGVKYSVSGWIKDRESILSRSKFLSLSIDCIKSAEIKSLVLCN